MSGGGTEADYVLPLRWTDDSGLDELTRYLEWLNERLRVIVVDGSPDLIFARHAAAWSDMVTHVRPGPVVAMNGKVRSVLTGMRIVAAERVIIADDDVRYDAESLENVLALLDDADLVGPQNVFGPMPWHARWDTARSLLNRAFGADYPGTFAIRASTFRSMGGYDGNILFENLELMRTVEAADGVVLRPRHLYVTRRPPSWRHFAKQRVRQAYDDLAQPGRLAALLAIAPSVTYLLASRRGSVVLAGAAASVAFAEIGRHRSGGTTVFPASASLFAPLWLAERGVCVWLAVGLRVGLGGVKYGDHRLRTAAHSRRYLQGIATGHSLRDGPSVRARNLASL